MDPAPSLPALFGDGRGIYRVHILGNSGTGKASCFWQCITTTALTLARILQVPYISLDRIIWKPGWNALPQEEFMRQLRTALDENANKGWVVDGDYQRKGAAMVFEEATDIIWLDPPLLLYYPRLITRTFLRLVGLAEPCIPGCFESFSDVFLSRDSIIWWTIRYHWEDRRRNQAKLDEVHLASEDRRRVSHPRMRRIGGWGRDLKEWLRSVEMLVLQPKRQH
ncbi:hypothetical protein CVT26_012511 [Gymnopilus dilepis]|uniref:Adenylate kinase n=1 Tax=Gymnopilus dilepis TaxID=231916 RepID=A0A409YWB7_9AGAR|nr:hypothetical protein CVT26_012511 [Gymnopilus dilepis]